MESHGINTRKLWHEIKIIIIKTVLAMVPEIMLNYEQYFYGTAGPQCFQVIFKNKTNFKSFTIVNHICIYVFTLFESTSRFAKTIIYEYIDL